MSTDSRDSQARAVLINLVVGASAVVVFAGTAYADVPPPPGYVERCTLERTCPVGRECVSCPEDYSDTTACARKLEAQGFTKQCKTAGASVWDEVWCRPIAGARDANVAPDANDGGAAELISNATVCRASEGCSCRVVGGRREPRVGAALTLALLAVAWRTRRRAHAQQLASEDEP